MTAEQQCPELYRLYLWAYDTCKQHKQTSKRKKSTGTTPCLKDFWMPSASIVSSHKYKVGQQINWSGFVDPCTM